MKRDQACYLLMRRIAGEHLQPFTGHFEAAARQVGTEVARLHVALRKIAPQVEGRDSNLMAELDGWVTDTIRARAIAEPPVCLAAVRGFEGPYNALPRQLIHRDVHLGNMLFHEGRLTGFIDFDISQVNARVFALAYFGLSLLVGRFEDAETVSQWRSAFGAFLAGYRLADPTLQSAEVEAIYPMSVAIELVFIACFASADQTDLVPGCVRMAEWIQANRQVFVFD